jgi:hypothetical protein
MFVLSVLNRLFLLCDEGDIVNTTVESLVSGATDAVYDILNVMNMAMKENDNYRVSSCNKSLEFIFNMEDPDLPEFYRNRVMQVISGDLVKDRISTTNTYLELNECMAEEDKVKYLLTFKMISGLN